MFTVILAWINAKYKCDYEFLFFATVFLDMVLLFGVFYLLGVPQ